jgi:hypothetical protein
MNDAHLRSRSGEYRLKAEDCLSIAGTVGSEQHKSQFLELALFWFHLAEQAEKNSTTDIFYETPPETDGT